MSNEGATDRDTTDDGEVDGPRRRFIRRRLLQGGAATGLLGAGLVGVKTWISNPAPDHPWFRAGDPDVLVMAHAGGKALRPDNTMEAFDHAAEVGADVLETDVHVTADGVPVCIHDATVDARTDGSGRVDGMSLSELKALDGAYNWSPPGGEGQPYRGREIEIPTLAEAFVAHPDARWNVEIKPAVADPAPVCAVIRDHDMTAQVLVASFSSLITEFRTACPAVATSAHRNEVLRFLAASRVGLEATYDAPAQAFQVPRRSSGIDVLTDGFVDAAHSRGMDVHAWTINERQEMRRLVELGVDGLITDRPARALSVLGRTPSLER